MSIASSHKCLVCCWTVVPQTMLTGTAKESYSEIAACIVMVSKLIMPQPDALLDEVGLEVQEI